MITNNYMSQKLYMKYIWDSDLQITFVYLNFPFHFP